MADCSCASAHPHAHAGTSPLPSSSSSARPSAELRDQCEHIVFALMSARELLRLLGDCGSANADSIAEIRVESLAVLLRCLSEQLEAAEPLIDAMAGTARKHAPGTNLSGEIEAQGAIVFAVRHTLCALYDAIGHRCRDLHQIDVEALAGSAHRLASRLSTVEARLSALSFSLHAAPAPVRAPAPVPAVAAAAEAAKPIRAPRAQRHPLRVSRVRTASSSSEVACA